eukprot:scaffold39939_cov30-Tisochrysis_lutea.AAC.3
MPASPCTMRSPPRASFARAESISCTLARSFWRVCAAAPPPGGGPPKSPRRSVGRKTETGSPCPLTRKGDRTSKRTWMEKGQRTARWRARKHARQSQGECSWSAQRDDMPPHWPLGLPHAQRPSLCARRRGRCQGVLAPLSIPHRPGKDSAGGEPHPRLMAQLSQRAHDLQSAQHAAHRVVLVLVGRRAEGRKEYGALVVDVETREHALEASNLSSDGAKHLLGLCNDGIEHFMLPLMVQAKDAYEEDGRKTKVREPIHPCSAQTVLDGFGHIGCQPERGFGRALDET